MRPKDLIEVMRRVSANNSYLGNSYIYDEPEVSYAKAYLKKLSPDNCPDILTDRKQFFTVVMMLGVSFFRYEPHSGGIYNQRHGVFFKKHLFADPVIAAYREDQNLVLEQALDVNDCEAAKILKAVLQATPSTLADSSALAEQGYLNDGVAPPSFGQQLLNMSCNTFYSLMHDYILPYQDTPSQMLRNFDETIFVEPIWMWINESDHPVRLIEFLVGLDAMGSRKNPQKLNGQLEFIACRDNKVEVDAFLNQTTSHDLVDAGEAFKKALKGNSAAPDLSGLGFSKDLVDAANDYANGNFVSPVQTHQRPLSLDTPRA
jgi:hypothetical protein